MNELKVAVGYVRCSTDQQEDSPDQQKKAVLEFAAARGYRITEWYVDFGKSGTTFEQRGEFQRLRSAVENRPSFVAVICYDESRWGRAIDAEENTFWRVYFRRHGVDVVLVKTSIDPDHEYAPMMKAFEGVQASQYSKNLSALTMRGTMNNGRFSSGGTAPFGYNRIAVNLKTGIERGLNQGEWCVKKQEKVAWVTGAPGEVETVRFIFEQRAKGVAYVLIAKTLNDRGVPCPKRGKWRNADQKWSSGTIKCIVENPAYHGARAYNRMSSSKIIAKKKGRPPKENRSAPVWRNDQSEWVMFDHAHAAIVDKDLWARANTVGKGRPRVRRNAQSYFSKYLLTGLIRCSKCGFAFQGWSGKVKGKEYYRYIDGGWQNKRVCDFLSIPRDHLEAFALASVRETLSELIPLGKINQALQALVASKPTVVKSEKARLTSSVTDCDNRIGNLLTIVESGMALGATVKARLRELEEERETLARQLESFHQESSETKIEDVSRLVSDFVSDFEHRFDEAPIEERKSLIQKCISAIQVDREDSIVRFYVRRVPSVTLELQEASEPMQLVMSGKSARNRT